MAEQTILVQSEPRGPSLLIEIPVTPDNAGQKVPLPQVNTLLNQEGQTIIIKAIRLITPKVLLRAITLNLVNAPITELVNMSLTIYSDQYLKGENIPILTFNDFHDSDATAATTIPFRSKPTRLANWTGVSWNQCYLLFSNGFVPTPSYAVLLDVEYIKLDGKGNIITTPR